MARKSKVLSAEQVVEIVRRYKAGEGPAALAQEFHISRQYIYALGMNPKYNAIAPLLTDYDKLDGPPSPKERLRRMLDTSLTILESKLAHEAKRPLQADLKKITDLYNKVSGDFHKLDSRTSDDEPLYKCRVSIEEVLALPPDKRAEYLLSRVPLEQLIPKAHDDVPTEDGGAAEVEVPDGESLEPKTEPSTSLAVMSGEPELRDQLFSVYLRPEGGGSYGDESAVPTL